MSEVVKTKSSGNILKILILVLLVLILVGGAGFGGFIMAQKFPTKAGTSTTTANQAATIEEAYYDGGEFLANLSDTDSKRYLKIQLILAYDSKNKKLPDELTTKVNVIKDCVISVMRTKKAADLTPKGSDDLKAELMTRINSVLTKGKLTNVYYNDFIVQ
ncbi:MAG: flagellar basal body-associated FliL family protein [Bacillota bacterium]|nr:flagellar basal body-associated FliL family protein [Bacillota bacterium]